MMQTFQWYWLYNCEATTPAVLRERRLQETKSLIEFKAMLEGNKLSHCKFYAGTTCEWYMHDEIPSEILNRYADEETFI